ncbi:hypothetical protein CXQ84_31265 [Burkholderia pseudomallei]|nr:hypothetical protein CXQ84_31265 [Burkholderia pseudomallei]
MVGRGARFAVHGSRFTVHGSRFTVHGSRFTVRRLLAAGGGSFLMSRVLCSCSRPVSTGG